MSTQSLPRLLDRRSLAESLGIKLSSAERIMRQLPKVQIGRRVFVREADVADYLRRASSS